MASRSSDVSSDVNSDDRSDARDLLTSIAGSWQGTASQIQKLIKLRYTQEPHNPIVDLSRRDILFEIVGMLIKGSFKSTFDFLKGAVNPEYIFWEQPAMEEGRNALVRELNVRQSEVKGVKGVGKCRYCPSIELIFTTKQTRSADEPMTVIVRCVICQKTWRQ